MLEKLIEYNMSTSTFQGVTRMSMQICVYFVFVVLTFGCTITQGSKPSTPDGNASSVTSRADPTVRSVQLKLQQLGLDPGPIDGLLGKQTKRAIRYFQYAELRAQNGKIDEYLVGDLNTRINRRKVGWDKKRPSVWVFATTGRRLSHGVGVGRDRLEAYIEAIQGSLQEREQVVR